MSSIKKIKKINIEGVRGPYLQFALEKRPIIIKQNPTLTVCDVSKMLGTMWQRMSEDEKRKYVDMSNKDKLRYQREMEAYNNF